MNKPIFKIFAQGVIVETWENKADYKTKEGNINTVKSYAVSMDSSYLDKQGVRQFKKNFPMDKLPLLIAGLQKTYDEFNLKMYRQNKEVKDEL